MNQDNINLNQGVYQHPAHIPPKQVPIQHIPPQHIPYQQVPLQHIPPQQVHYPQMNNLQVHHPQIPQQQEPFVQQKVAYADQQKIYADQINQSSFTSGWLAFSEPSYLRGFLLAAGIAFAVSSPKIREIVSTGAIKTWAALQGGVEEFKEKIHDVRAEMSRESSEQDKE